jgi:hypothetical protein
MTTIIVILTAAAASCLFVFIREIRKKNINIWLFSYLKQVISAPAKTDNNKPVHIMFCFVDHFEPTWNKADYNQEVIRVDTWMKRYRELASKHKDSNGRHPQHSFFYPEEEYRKEHLDKIAALCREGFGDVEIHLHHDNDTADGLRTKIEGFKKTLDSHGLLTKDKNGNITYGFIHGNWALDNSRKDGRMCGINNELIVLKDTGCYADFTLPSAPSDTQVRKINSIYYATDDPCKPKSHDTGVDVEAGKNQTGDLMIIQGPLTLNWKSRKWGFLPRIENGEIASNCKPAEERVDLWIKQHIHVKGMPNWIFVKVHTHGCQEKHFETLLGEPTDKMFTYLETKYNDGKKYILHYVNAREMYDIIKALESGRDYIWEK